MPCISDYSLNAANELTATYLQQQGALRVTASYDLNRDQLIDMARHARVDVLEVVIHQHMPMFHMEHCVFCAVLSPGTNKTNCGRPCDRHRVQLRDRVGSEHTLQADVGCRNTLFNGTPQSGAEAVEQLLRLGVRSFRVEFLHDEPPAQLCRCVDLYRDLIARPRIRAGSLDHITGCQSGRRHARYVGAAPRPAGDPVAVRGQISHRSSFRRASLTDTIDRMIPPLCKTLVLATGNPHKVRELSELLSALDVQLTSLADWPATTPVDEDGATPAENARKKASGYARQLKQWVLADDTALCVDALDGAPGVRSARYAGAHATMAENRAQLLAELAHVPDPQRTAQFVCHLAVANPAGDIVMEASGHLCGTHSPRADGRLVRLWLRRAVRSRRCQPDARRTAAGDHGRRRTPRTCRASCWRQAGGWRLEAAGRRLKAGGRRK